MFTENVDNLDKILDELEDMARSDLSSARFYPVLVERLRLSVQATSAAFWLPIEGGGWLPLAHSGQACAFMGAALQQGLATPGGAATAPAPERLLGKAEGQYWCAIPVRPRQFSKGCLVVCLAQPLPEQTVADFIQWMAAFAEVIALRQNAEVESFLNEDWERMQTLCGQLTKTATIEEACDLLAAGLPQTLRASRVSLMTPTSTGGVVVRAVSGVPAATERTPTLRALGELGLRTLRSGRPELRQQPTPPTAAEQPLAELAEPPPAEINADGTFANAIVVPLAGHSGQQAGRVALALEFPSYGALMASATQLPHLLPPLSVTWGQHARWLAIPRPLRALAMGPAQATAWAAPLAKRMLALALLLLAAWALFRPYPLTIEAQGAYQPALTRSIYATADGFIEELLVDDAQAVEVGQPLAKLRSPTLDLRLEQVQGELRSCTEESNGIRIALNQLNPDSAELLNQQSRLASKIQELETRQQGLERQAVLLQQDRARLTLLAPIRGVVVAKDLQQHLARRPVQRGDPLFAIVDLDGPWQIRVRVADRDSGYVLDHYAPPATPPPAEPRCSDPQEPLQDPLQVRTSLQQSASAADAASPGPPRQELDFVFDSAPSERLTATIHWIADHVENQNGEGCFVEVRATTSAGGPLAAHAGAGVRAHFYCGTQPLWFVWCRPLVEAAQGRLWFPSH